jgi:hypothetical protein
MNTQKFLMVALLLVIFQSCRNGDRDHTEDFSKEPDETVNKGSSDEPTPLKVFDYITGTWTLNNVVRGSENILSESATGEGQKIVFTREGRYIRYSKNAQVDSGGYTVNEHLKTVYLDSESPGEPEAWDVSFMEDGMMSMEIRNGSKHAESMTYLYKRKGEREKENVELIGDENE